MIVSFLVSLFPIYAQDLEKKLQDVFIGILRILDRDLAQIPWISSLLSWSGQKSEVKGLYDLTPLSKILHPDWCVREVSRVSMVYTPSQCSISSEKGLGISFSHCTVTWEMAVGRPSWERLERHTCGNISRFFLRGFQLSFHSKSFESWNCSWSRVSTALIQVRLIFARSRVEFLWLYRSRRNLLSGPLYVVPGDPASA